MRRWFTSDLHIGHAKVLEYCERPFASLDEMHEELIRRWNAVVAPDDEVYILGDLAFCFKYAMALPILQRLNGKKILVKGNHDGYSDAQYRRAGIVVYHELKIKINGRDVRLSHYPYWPKWFERFLAYKSELRYPERRPPRVKGEILLHGHTHSDYKMSADYTRIHVGVDAWGYRPVAESEIASLIARSKC